MKPALALLVLCVLAPAGGAYGTFEPLNEPGTLLRGSVADPAYAAADETLVAAGDAPLSRRIHYRDDNATWQIYSDRDGDGRYGGPEEDHQVEGHYLPNATFRHARADGNATDHLEVTLAHDGTRFRLCTERAEDGLVEGRARGLRCNGDVDRDGTGDVEEVGSSRNPLRPRGDDREDPLLPLLP